MTRECKNIYKELCQTAGLYNQGLITRLELANELGWFLSCQLDTNIKPQTQKINNYLERVLVNGR